MTAARVAGAVLVLVVVGAYAALAVRWTANDPGWYAALPRPAWQPPDVVFGVIWPLNFVALCVSGLAVVSQAAPRDIAAWLALLVEFYVPHHLGRAAVLLACAAILTWILVVVTHGLVAWAGWVLVPYAVWLTVATSLAVGYWQLVPSPAAPGS